MNLFLILGLTTGAFATDYKTLLKEYRLKIMVNEVLDLRPIDKHHFNFKAPNRCEKGKLTKKSATHIKCQFSEPGKQKFRVAICDDPESFCKIEDHTVDVYMPTGMMMSKVIPQYIAPKSQKKAPKGFIENDTKKALALAKKNKSLILVDFFGIWCPPCNLLDELVFDTKAFQDETKDIVKLALDADSDLSFEWKDHFQVGGYPTVVLTNAKKEEIGRVVGYREVGAFVRWIRKNRNLPPIAKVLGQKKHRLREAEWRYDRGEYEKARDLLKGSKVPKERLLHLKADLRVPKDKKKTLRHLIKEFSGEIQFTNWVLRLAKEDKNEAKQYFSQALRSLKSWRKNPKRHEQGYTIADLWYKEGRLLETFDPESGKVKRAFSNAADVYGKLAAKSKLKTPRGANLDRAYSLFKAGRQKEARELYQRLADRYPNEFTFNYYFASALHKMKDHKAASKYAKRAVQNSYGDNWLRAVHLQAKVEMAEGKLKAAKSGLDRALEEIVSPESSQVRTHRYISRIRDLRSEIMKQL